VGITHLIEGVAHGLGRAVEHLSARAELEPTPEIHDDVIEERVTHAIALRARIHAEHAQEILVGLATSAYTRCILGARLPIGQHPVQKALYGGLDAALLVRLPQV